ncbi:MAG: response regulator [Parvibaculaceae bacterium]
MSQLPHLLVVDDDREIRDLLKRFLTKHGFRVTLAEDGRACLSAIEDGRFDLVVLDVMMPGEDGLSVCRRIRATSSLPVIMLTAMGEETDRIIGLEIGADDYLPKPFNPRELLARVRAILRRAEPAQETPVSGGRFAFEGWHLDPRSRTLTNPDGAPVELTSGEFDLLLAFAERPNRVLSRDQLLDITRGREAMPFDRSIDVQLSRLRRKIEDDHKSPRLIKTIRGGGYMFATEVVRS